MTTNRVTLITAAALALAVNSQMIPCELDPENPDCPWVPVPPVGGNTVCCSDPSCPDYDKCPQTQNEEVDEYSCWDYEPNLCMCHEPVKKSGKNPKMYDVRRIQLEQGGCVDFDVVDDAVVWVASHYPYCTGTCKEHGYTVKSKDPTSVFIETQGTIPATMWTKPTANDILDLIFQ